MSIRPTQQSLYSLVTRGLGYNLSRLAHAQERVATGKEILRPSDDAVGTARALSMRRRLGLINRFQESVGTTRPVLETSTSALEEVSLVLRESRELMITGMSGSLSSDDREAIGQQLHLLLEKLVDVANTKIGDRFVFAGTETVNKPYTITSRDGKTAVNYNGNDQVQRIAVGFGTEIPINIPGSKVFGSSSVESVDLSGITGVKLGTTANQGEGFANLYFRHNATTGTPGSGITLVNGGDDDTILNNHSLTVDAVAGTVQLDDGVLFQIPDPSSAEYTDLTVVNNGGEEVHLDFSGYTGASSTAALFGEGSVSINGSVYIPIDFTETDLELVHPGNGTVLHINTTEVHRADAELVSFSGATDIFNVLAGAAADMKNAAGLESQEAVNRLELRYDELLRGLDQALKSLGTLGARTERLNSSEIRLETTTVNLEGLLTQVEDVDITTVILDMNQAEQTLQLAQATGSRLIQHTLLNYLR